MHVLVGDDIKINTDKRKIQRLTKACVFFCIVIFPFLALLMVLVLVTPSVSLWSVADIRYFQTSCMLSGTISTLHVDLFEKYKC